MPSNPPTPPTSPAPACASGKCGDTAPYQWRPEHYCDEPPEHPHGEHRAYVGAQSFISWPLKPKEARRASARR